MDLTGRSLLRNEKGVRHLTFNSHVTKEFLKQFVCMFYYVKQNITLLLTWFFHQWANLILSLKVLRVQSFRPQAFQNHEMEVWKYLLILYIRIVYIVIRLFNSMFYENIPKSQFCSYNTIKKYWIRRIKLEYRVKIQNLFFSKVLYNSWHVSVLR